MGGLDVVIIILVHAFQSLMKRERKVQSIQLPSNRQKNKKKKEKKTLTGHLTVGLLWGALTVVFFFKPICNNYWATKSPRCKDTIIKHGVWIWLRLTNHFRIIMT